MVWIMFFHEVQATETTVRNKDARVKKRIGVKNVSEKSEDYHGVEAWKKVEA